MASTSSPPEADSTSTVLTREEVNAARKQRREDKKRKRVDDGKGDRPLPEAHHCSYWMTKKRRYCSLQRNHGSVYCTEHLTVVDGEKRVPCPLDPRHWIFEYDLAKHTSTKCPARKVVGQDDPWFSKDINAGEVDIDLQDDTETPEATSSHQQAPTAPESQQESKPETLWEVRPEVVLHKRRFMTNGIKEYSDERISELLGRLDGLWSVFEPSISSDMIISEVPSPDAAMGAVKVKHAIQNYAIMQHLQLANMWDKKYMYIEWGCGNANLSLDIQNALQSNHILVDRKVPKTKGDWKRDPNLLWKRLTIDIKDLNLSRIPELASESPVDSAYQHHSLCSFSKHLCGAATDLTIRSLQNYESQREEDKILIALCCHHRCTWQTYVGKDFFMDTLGLDTEDFEIMARMSSWATSNEHDKQATQNEGLLTTNLSSEDRGTWGWRCKRLIDLGRLHYLRSIGFETLFRYYVPKAVSLENILMICQRIPSDAPVNGERAL